MEVYMKFDIREEIRQCTSDFRLGYIVIRNVKVQGASPSLSQKLFQLQTALAAVYNIDELAKMSKIAGVRSVYNQNNFDATRYTSEGETLVRRVLQSKDAYYVNSAVAASNYCSLKFLLPTGLYDLDQIKGDISYGVSAGETYVNINGEKMLTDDQPFLRDDIGVLGNDTVHVRRTAVTLSTKNLLAIVYGNETVIPENFMHILSFMGRRMTRYNGGVITTQEIIEA